MKTTCPHCDQHIEIDDDSAEMLKELESFECPTCSGVVPVPKASDSAPEKSTARTSSPQGITPNALMAVFGRMNRTMRILGVLALLVVGGLAIFLATRKSGDTHNITIKNRDEIIQNEFFTRLIASRATTEEELKKVQSFVPYGAGYLGLSEEGWNWNEAELLARRVSADVADMALLPHDSRNAFGTLIAEQFSASLGEAAWVRENGEPRLIDSPDLLKTKALDRPRRVFLSWPKSGDWKNHGWSWTIAAQFDEVAPFSEWGLAAVRAGKQWGIINESGQFVQPAQFDLVEKFSEKGCARVSVGDKWGLLNGKGELVAKPAWEDVQDQISGFTPVKREGKWGYLDAAGTLAIACEWDDAWRFSPEGFAVVTRDFKRGIIDRSGKVIVAAEWDGAINFSKEGFGLVRRGEGWALIDTTGKLLTEPTVKARWKDRRWDLGILPTEDGVVGMDGKEIVGERSERLMALTDTEERFSEGLARVDTESGSGFIDTFGEWVIPPSTAFCRDFAGGFAAARIADKWGFIDLTGKPVMLAEWDEVGDFSEGAAGVKRGERWGLIGRDGKLISDPVWDEVRAFRGGFAAVRREEKWGFVNRSGKVVAQPTWKAVGDFSEGFASVQVEPTPEQLAVVPEYRRRFNWSLDRSSGKRIETPNFAFWSFIDSTGKIAFEGRIWFASVHSRSTSPVFVNGTFRGELVERPALRYSTIDTAGNEPATRGMEITPGLFARKEFRGNYPDRFGNELGSINLHDSDRKPIMPEAASGFDGDFLGDLIPYATPPKYGLIDMAGKVIVPPTWDETKILSPDRVWIKVDGKCGLADGRGRILIEPKWDELEVLEVDTGSLAEDGTTILLGQSGKPILSPWVRARDGETIRYLREDGSPAIPDSMPNATCVDFYDRERIVIREPVAEGGELLSVFHPATGGKRTFPAAAKLRWNWNTANLGFVWLQDKESLRWHLRGKNGEVYNHSQPELEKPEGWGFIEGRGRLHQEGGWFHIAADGKPISAERWEDAHDFSEGRAAVKRADKWGYVGLDGAIITEMVYEEALDFSEGLAAVKIEGRWGFIDPAGAMAIAPVWDEVQSFVRWYGEPADGSSDTPCLEVAEVKINGAAALIGRDGDLIIDPRLPKLSRDGSSYGNGNGQWIVMKTAESVTVVPRQWKASDQSWRPYLETSPTRRWQERPDRTGWNLVDETGAVLSEGNWDRPWYDVKIDPFSGGLISARTTAEKYGLLRYDGSPVVEPNFDRIAWVAPGIAAVWNRDKGGLMKADGTWLFLDNEQIRIARFDSNRNPRTGPQFRHGLAVIEDVPRWGYARLNRTAPPTP